ncbi:sodium-dependent nutrient amino acid transporter 1-like isoform X1 [Diorhabda carinulata]|uniref:sodium-dependent nutrient amino acid transporter 1-like isoform X1 n=1 Tax=Diorhabda carinulata TaxID=1163345 RepID=UPI0025A2A511|nr:sodium-dependent nutrient amino acid transporter 1-like isoform X1 [Diorhabda carinulata]
MRTQNNCSVTESDNFEDDDNKLTERSQWGNELEFLMSCIAMSVGLGNVWRFPFIANENGGGAFLIPYIIVLTVIARPMYYMEMTVGQFTSRGPVKTYSKLSPVLKGIGITHIIGSTCVASYYCILMAITLCYLINSFTSNFPWATCSSDWDEYLRQRNLTCVDTKSTLSNHSGRNTISSSELYYRREILKQKDDISDGIGFPDWKLTLFLLLSWFVTFLISSRGVRSSGKAAYFLAIFPYIIMLTLLVRAVTLPGALDGMLYFIETDFSKLLEAKVWYAAVTQCFFSLNIGFGNIITLASYNKFNHNINRDALIVTTLDTFTSLFSGITIFGILGNLALELGIPPSEVVSPGGGAGIAFISYPDALSKFTFAPWLFAIAFFVMLFVLGIGSLAALHVNLNSLFKDAFPNVADWKISGCTALCLFLVGLIYTTPGGQYVLDLADFFGGTFVIFTGALCEIFVILYLYGVENLCIDLEFMTKRIAGLYWRITWLVIPILLLIIFVYFVVTLEPLVYGIDSLPVPIGLKVFGWGIVTVMVVQMIGYLLYYLYKNWKYPGIQKFTKTFSTETYGPDGVERTNAWKEFKQEKKLQQKAVNDSLIKRKLKILLGK